MSDKKHLTTEILKYPVPDIGYSKKAVGTIYPLGISDLNTSFVLVLGFGVVRLLLKMFLK